jgi:hypothetical protein
MYMNMKQGGKRIYTCHTCFKVIEKKHQKPSLGL